MHEVSIASSVLRTVTDAVPGRRVRAVRVQVGVLTAVVPSALHFAWDVVRQETLLEQAELFIEAAPVRVDCARCRNQGTLDQPLPVRCPICGGRDVEVIGGQELQVLNVEVDDELVGAGDAP